jgi:AcrR family transcriptional regulator
MALTADAGRASVKQERAKQTRARILMAAARQFERMGYASARLDDIGRDANVTKGALYFHFRSKAHLARALLDAHFARWQEIRTDLAARSLDPLSLVVAFSFAVARNYGTSEIARAGVRLGNEYQMIDADLPTPFVGWIDALSTLLERAQQAGELAGHVDCRVAARGIVASYFGLQEVSARLTGGKDLIRRLREWWQLFLPALVSDADLTATILARIDHRGAVRAA